jgi:hypothetical protein
LTFLRDLEARLSVGRSALRHRRGFTDAAIMPFVRQFAAVDKIWFDAEALSHVQNWLNGHLESDLFGATMVRLTPWSAGDHPIFFPSYESSSTVG